MVANKAPTISCDRRQWQKVFNALVHMLRTQQTHLESLVKERKILEDRIQIQYDRWVSDVHLLEEQISQMKRDLLEAEKGRFLEVAKSELVVGLKQRESFLYKNKLEHTESELEDFRLWFDYLTRKCADQNEKSGDENKVIDKGKIVLVDDNPNSTENNKREERSLKVLEGELKKLKCAYEELTSKNNSEVSALLSERNFVWNQFKRIENDYTNLQKSKRIEVEQANEKIEKLLMNIEQLQSSKNGKDEIIVELKAKLAKVEADKDKGNIEISRLSKELEFLRNSSSASGTTPVLNRCTMEPSTCSLESQKNCRDRRPIVKKWSTVLQASDNVKNPEKESRSSKRRRGVEAIPTSSGTPRLFSSTFKVPKLKNSSP